MSFLLTLYYVVTPTTALAAIAKEHDLDGLVDELAVFRMERHSHHLMGAERELRDALWTTLIGGWDLDGAEEAERIKSFLRACLVLEPDQCWTIQQAREGGDASELFSRAEQYAPSVAINTKLARG
jgi:hypothetical protein